MQTQQEEEDDESKRDALVYPFLDPENLDMSVVDPETQTRTPAFSLKVTHLSSDHDFLANVRNLNIQQRTLFDHLFTWATNERLQSNPTKPFYIFLTGGAGCGKTYLINTLYERLYRALRGPG
ncbi:hypothetical protein DPMN_181469 [Dreissena polymorpha]|uniref:ATP-dependent DNA helicase n=1 Tax=Dreissena polymorpha TaxID=45954 RepID=A0A9D4DDL4_DREPO|nr:hypothetical protein DPMN_181469 [Dreissena polymorpha]